MNNSNIHDIDDIEKMRQKNVMKKIFYLLQVKFGLRPRGFCLITGCPRSGTSAVGEWLGSQRKVSRFYESRILIAANRFIGEIEKFLSLYEDQKILIKSLRKLVYDSYARHKYIWGKLLVDKEPLEPTAFPYKKYRDFLENIRLGFPEIQLLFLIRDPIETIWSMRQRKWGYSLTDQTLREYSLEECIDNWNACADLICEYASKRNVYVCRFEQLIAEPEIESHKIFEFLSFNGNTPFQPKSTSTVKFSNEECDYILSATQVQRERLSSVVRCTDSKI